MTAPAFANGVWPPVTPNWWLLSKPQLRVMRCPARFVVWIAGRRTGKTEVAKAKIVAKAMEKARSLNYYIAPTYTQAKRILWRSLKYQLPNEYVLAVNESELTIELVNGSIIQLLGADNPQSLRGPGPDFAVFDEFRWMSPDVWYEVIQPAMANSEGGALFISSPDGMNWAYDLWLKGQDTDPLWRSFQSTTLEGGWVRKAEIERARGDLDARLFRQEYEASFEAMHGRVYANFHRAAFPQGNLDAAVADAGGELLIGQDFNVNPMATIIAQRVADECHVLDALEIPTSNTEELATELKHRYPGRRIVVCPDPSGRARKTSAAVGITDFTILERAGFEVRADSRAPLVVDRVNVVQSMLQSADGRRRLRIHPRATKLVRALDGLTYKEHTSQPDKSTGLDHITDALGYLCWQEFNLIHPRTARPFRVGF